MFFELMRNSSILCFSIVLLITWIYFLIDFLGEHGILLTLGICHVIIFASFPLYLFEYWLTEETFKNSVSGLFFFVSSIIYVVTIISAFLLQRYVIGSSSFCDKLLAKIERKSLDKR